MGAQRGWDAAVAWLRSPAAAWPLLVLILLAGAAIRFKGLDREGLWGDEYIQVAEYRLPAQYTALNAVRHHGLGPVDFLIGWVVHRISPTVWAYRFPAAMFGVLSIGALFLLVRRIASWQAGLIAASLLAACRLHLVLSQEVRPYSITLFVLLVTLILLLRALERPTFRRVFALALAALLCPLTRSFTGMVFQAAMFIAVSAAWFDACRRDGPFPARRALKRVWWALAAVGLATVPFLLYLLSSLRVYTVLPGGFKQNFWQTSGRLVDKFVYSLGVVGDTLMGNYGLFVLLVALFGLGACLVRWKRSTMPTRIVMCTMVLAGPIFVVVYTIMVRYQPILPRYNFYLMPIVAALSGIGAVAALRPLARRAPRRRRTIVCAGVVLIAGILSYPAGMSAKESQSYRRLDWRGCANELGRFVQEEDVVMVLSDRPFGRPQITFLGKHDWDRRHRPLAEAMWTFATSPSHFERLTKKTGRCFIVLTYLIAPRRRDAYLARGLRAAPPGYLLSKFRGLDLLIPSDIGTVRERRPVARVARAGLGADVERPRGLKPAARHQDAGHANAALALFEEMIRSCTDLLALPHEHPSANAVVFALRARLLHHLGRDAQAADSLRAARTLVPSAKLEVFDHLTSSWAKALTTGDSELRPEG